MATAVLAAERPPLHTWTLIESPNLVRLPPLHSGDEAVLDQFVAFFSGAQLDKGTEVTLLWRAGARHACMPCWRACHVLLQLHCCCAHGCWMAPHARHTVPLPWLCILVLAWVRMVARLASPSHPPRPIHPPPQTAAPTCACARQAPPLLTPPSSQASVYPAPWGMRCGSCTWGPPRPHQTLARPGCRRWRSCELCLC